MRSRFVRKALVKAMAARFAAEALTDIDLTLSDFDGEDSLSAEERVAIYTEIRAISNRLLLEAERLDALR